MGVSEKIVEKNQNSWSGNDSQNILGWNWIFCWKCWKVLNIQIIRTQCIVCVIPELSLIRHSRLPAGNALWFCQNLLLFFFYFFFFLLFFFFLFFRHQGFRMITFDRQAGPLQNFNRSHIMVIGRTPQNPPPPPPKNKFLFACVSEPQEHFWKQNFSREKKTQKFFAPPPPPPQKKNNFFLRFKTPGTFLSEKKNISVKNSTLPPSPPPPPARPRPVLRTLTPILVQ